MKQVAWVLGLVVGVSGCSGTTIGGDLPGQAGASPGVGSNGAVGGSGNSATGGALGEGDSGNSAIGGALAEGGSGNSAIGGAPGAGGSGNSAIGGAPGAGGSGTGAAAGAGFDSCTPQVDAWIAFDSDAADFNRDLYVMRPDGSKVTRLTTDDSIDKEPSFSPDGVLLSFTSDRDGSLQIYVLDLASRAVTQVTHRPEGADSSSFSADSTLIAFHSGASVYVIKPDGSGETLVATGLDTFNAYFSPRFIGNDQLVFDRNNEIDAAELDGTKFRNIVQNTTTEIKAPSISPRGNELAYSTLCGNDASQSIWTTSATVSTVACGGRRVSPAADASSDEHPAWGPDDLIAYESSDRATNISRITLSQRQAGSTPCVLTGANTDSRDPSWSPVGLDL